VITRSADHRYTYEGITYPGVSDIIECIGASFSAASGWGGKMASSAAIRLVDELPKMIETLGEVGAQRALNSRSNWGPDPSGSELGSRVHELVEDYLTGKPERSLTKPEGIRLRHFQDWWTASGWKLRLSEAMVINKGGDDGRGWGGTFDLLAYDQDGRTVLGDLKTGSVHAKAVIQLAAYGMASLVQPAGADKVYPMPLPDRYVILHLTEEGLRPIEVSVGTPERMAFLSALDIYHWQQTMKGVKL
jgi:hypothetical protein